jgi:hypothetical protein
MKTVDFVALVKDVVLWEGLHLDHDPLSLLMLKFEEYVNRFKGGAYYELARTDPDRVWKMKDFEAAELLVYRVLGVSFEITPSIFIGPFIRFVSKQAERFDRPTGPVHHQMKIPGLEDNGFHFRNVWEDPQPPMVQYRCPHCSADQQVNPVYDKTLCPRCGNMFDLEGNQSEDNKVEGEE